MKTIHFSIYAIILGFISGASLATVSSEADAQIREEWHADVLRLFSLELRDVALQRLLKEARYPENPAYKEKDVGKIKHVVVCPQDKERPLLTVFVRLKIDPVLTDLVLPIIEPEDTSPMSGHFVVIRNDGMIIPFYHGANSLNGYLCDLNGNGVIDYIDSWGIRYEEGMVTSLHVVPIQEDFNPSLIVYWSEEMFTWRLHQPDLKRIPTIQIGMQKDEGFEIVAEYQWSFIKKQWIGPKGSPQKGFIVVEGDAKETAKELLKSQAEQDSPADTAKSRR